MAKKKEMKICSCCGENKVISEFYKSNSVMFKNDNKLPICKSCMIEIYEDNFQYYRNEEKALYKTLFSLDIIYDIKLAKKCIIDTFNTDKNLLKHYMSKVNLLQNRDLTAKSSPKVNIWDVTDEEIDDFEIEDLNIDTFLVTREMTKRWGEGRNVTDYIFLEEEYTIMCNTYGNKNPYSLSSYEQIALYKLFLKKEWEKPNPNPKTINEINNSISKIAGDCQMKDSQIDNNEDETARFSKFIEMVENKEPILNDPLYEDVDGIRKTIKEDYVRPMARALDLDDSGKELKRINRKIEDDLNDD